MNGLSNKASILWDFDGVIIDSNQVRGQGFKEIFKDYPDDVVAKLLDFHHENGGLSRYLKIRYFFEELLGEQVSDKQIAELAQSFSDIMKVELIQQKYIIQNTLEFIIHHFQKVDMHIVSGSDQKELRFLCQSLDIKKYFKSINGSPTHKNILVANILRTYHYNIEDVILIGDSINDFEAAEVNDITFAGYNNTKLKDKGNYIERFVC